MNGRDNTTAVRIKHVFRFCITDLSYHITGNVLNIDFPSLGINGNITDFHVFRTVNRLFENITDFHGLGAKRI